jgi:cytosine/adenosine deaminase-related metal-dependent hydrolase
MFAEMKLAALLAKGASDPGAGISPSVANAAAVPAITALRMATLNGAKAGRPAAPSAPATSTFALRAALRRLRAVLVLTAFARAHHAEALSFLWLGAFFSRIVGRAAWRAVREAEALPSPTKALGLGAKVGSVVVGKEADLIAVRRAPKPPAHPA